MTELKNAYRKFLIASDDLANRIRGGEIVGGKPFIKRAEICERYGISPVTAHKVQQELVKRGLLISRKGLPFMVCQPDDYHLQPLSEIIYLRQIPTYYAGIHGDMLKEGIMSVASKHEIPFREIYLELLDKQCSKINTAYECSKNSGLILMPYMSLMVRGAGYFLAPELRRVAVEFPLPETSNVLPDNFDGVETLLSVAGKNGAKSVLFICNRRFGGNPLADGEICNFGKMLSARLGMQCMISSSGRLEEIKKDIETFRPDALFFVSSDKQDSFFEYILPADKEYQPLLMAFSRPFCRRPDIAGKMYIYEHDAVKFGRRAAEILLDVSTGKIPVTEYIKGKLVLPNS